MVAVRRGGRRFYYARSGVAFNREDRTWATNIFCGARNAKRRNAANTKAMAKAMNEER
jgi:hypothetical protein